MREVFELSDVSVPYTIPGIRKTVAWSVYVGTNDVAALYRVVYQTENAGAGFTFASGVISPECLLL